MSPPTPPLHQGEAAGIVTRGIAAGIDVLVIGLGVAGVYVAWVALVFAWSPTSFTWPSVPFALLLGIAIGQSVVYLTAGWATTGRTYGSALLGLRVLARDGQHLHWAGALIRAVFCTFFPLGLAWVVLSRKRRSVQDVVLGTRVVYDWSRATTQVPPVRPR